MKNTLTPNTLIPNSLSIYCDGGSRSNPGPAASAFLVYNSEKKLIHSQGIYLGVATNNQAEYQAVLEAMKYLSSNTLSPNTLTFYLDSELVVKQLNGLYKIKDPILQTKHAEIKKILSTSHLALSTVNFSHIPREKNSSADLLVNQTLDEATSGAKS